MKKIIMLAIVSTIMFSLSLSSQDLKDTCACPKETQKTVKKTFPSPRPWRYVETDWKGLITKSFNDSIIIEDYSDAITLPVVANIPERFFPPAVSNLKEVNGSFNRHISIKKIPPVPVNHHCYNDDWSWLAALLLLGLIVLLVYLATRPQTVPSVTVHVPPTPPATPGYRAPVAPAVDLKDVYARAEASGSTVIVYPDGGFRIVPPVKKEDKKSPTETKDNQS